MGGGKKGAHKWRGQSTHLHDEAKMARAGCNIVDDSPRGACDAGDLQHPVCRNVAASTQLIVCQRLIDLPIWDGRLRHCARGQIVLQPAYHMEQIDSHALLSAGHLA